MLESVAADILIPVDPAGTKDLVPRAPFSSDILDRKEIAALLRCSTGHVSNLMNGKLDTFTPFPFFNVGRKKYSRVAWVLQWAEAERQGRC